MRIISRFHIRNDGNKEVARVEISINDASELPEKDGGIPGVIIDEGSIAWDIDTGDFYGMKETGVWKKQGDDDSSVSTSSLNLNRTIDFPEGIPEDYTES